jgi:SAM-dependent methyltransferase
MSIRELTATGLHAWLLARIQALSGISNESRVFDLGCKTGAWLQRLHDAGFRRLTGFDRRDDYFGASNVATFIKGDIAQSERLKLGSFDLITALDVFEYMPNPQTIFAFATTHLSAGGYLIIATPNVYSLRVRTRFFLTGKLTGFEDTDEPERIHPLELHVVERQIPENGLGLDRVLTYPEHGGDGTLWYERIAESALSLVLPNDLPGDSLCLFVRKQQ